MQNVESAPENETHNILWDRDTNVSLNSGQKTRPRVDYQEKSCHLVDITVQVDHGGKIKEM